jgi:hypothetical protein
VSLIPISVVVGQPHEAVDHTVVVDAVSGDRTLKTVLDGKPRDRFSGSAKEVSMA